MSQERVETVRRIYEAVEAGDREALVTLYHPDVELDFSRSPFREVLDRTTYRGIDGLRDFFLERFQDIVETRDDLEELIDAGDAVIAVVTSSGRGRTSGVHVARRHYGVWSFEEGRVRRTEWYGTESEARAAIGG